MNIISEINTIFNNREIAIGIWFIILVILGFALPKFRESIKSVLKALFEIKIIVFILFIAAYAIGTITLLKIINYWNILLLKDTIIWYCFPGFIMSVKYITSKEDTNLVKSIIIDNVELIIVFEFIINIYIFPLLAEIFIIPIITFIVLLELVTRRDKKNACISKFISILLFLIGLSIFIYSTYKIINDFNNFRTINTLKDFLLPLILAITYIPLIYIMILYSSYETLFIRLNFYYKEDRKLRKYIKKEIIKHCFLNYKKIKIITSRWMNFKNTTDVEIFLKSLRK